MQDKPKLDPLGVKGLSVEQECAHIVYKALRKLDGLDRSNRASKDFAMAIRMALAQWNHDNGWSMADVAQKFEFMNNFRPKQIPDQAKDTRI